MDKLKVAVIGTGIMGKSHARIYADMDSVELVGICDADKKVSEEAAKKYHTNDYQNADDLLKEEKPDAVSICVPTKFHESVALPFIKKKVDLLVEKPITSTLEEGRKLADMASKNNIKLMVGHVERFNPVVIEMKKRLLNKELGRIYSVNSSRMSPFPQRVVDVGVTIDLAVHEIDIINHLIGAKIKSVFAETSRKIHSSHEDLLIGTIRFSNETLGIINCNWLTPKKIREIKILGEKGMLEANYLTQELYFYKNEFTEKNFSYEKGFMNVVEGDVVKIKISTKEPLRNELEAFVECIQKNMPCPVTAEDGLNALFIAQKLVDSSKTNKVIEL